MMTKEQAIDRAVVIQDRLLELGWDLGGDMNTYHRKPYQRERNPPMFLMGRLHELMMIIYGPEKRGRKVNTEI